MNEKQRKMSDSIVTTWSEGRAILNRFMGLVNDVQLKDDEIADVLVSAFQRLVPDDKERKDIIETVRETADKLSPDLPFRGTILKVLDRVAQPRMTVVDGGNNS